MLVHDRNPESMRTVPRVCAAGRDSVPADPARAFFFTYFSKIRPRAGKSVSALTKTYLADIFLDPEIFPVFSIFQPPQHRPHVELRRPGSALRNPGFPFFTGGRAAGSGGRAAVSGIWGCWLRISASGIYIHLLPINRPCGRYVTLVSFFIHESPENFFTYS